MEGTITYNGQPVDGASVLFQPLDPNGEAGAGRTDTSGRFTMTSTHAQRDGAGVLPGEYRVLVTKREVVVPPVDPDRQAFEQGRITYTEYQERQAARPTYGGGVVPRPVELLPVRYGGPSSDLQATVERGRNNTFEFALVD